MGQAIRLLRTTTRFCFLAILCGATLEVCARVDDVLTWKAPFWGRYDHSLLSVKDRFGVHGRPRGQFEKWKLNQFGFRGPEISKHKPRGVYRIAVMGASETFGQAESPGMEYPAQLQAILDRAKPDRYQVLNTAVAGMSLPRIAEFLRDYVSQFDPDLVILYPVAADHLDFRCPAPRTAPRDPQPVRRPASARPSFRLRRRVRTAIKQFLPARIQEVLRVYQTRRRLQKYGVEKPWESPPPERLAAYREHLTTVVEEARRHGIEVLLATHAHRFAEPFSPRDQQMLVAWRKFYPLAGGDCLIQMEAEANEIVRRTASERNTYLVDLATAIPPCNENFSDFVHFTDRGAQIAAEALAKTVLAIDGPPTSRAAP